MTATDRPTVKVGDFFEASWGYDQTNVDYYEVVAITPSGKSVKVRRCPATTIRTEGHADYLVPQPGPLTRTFRNWETGETVTQEADIQTKRLRESSYHHWSFNVASYADAYLWDGHPAYQTAIGYGH